MKAPTITQGDWGLDSSMNDYSGFVVSSAFRVIAETATDDAADIDDEEEGNARLIAAAPKMAAALANLIERGLITDTNDHYDECYGALIDAGYTEEDAS
tara:strand:+ start:318 stop:614 length:297 start_codon:yes stop_codon:yes gene_type:complete